MCPALMLSLVMAGGLTKRCCTCKRLLPVSEFNRRTRASDGLQSRCRACCRAWYLANRDSHRAATNGRSKAIREELSRKLLDYLKAHPCVDCGMNDLRCLEFDHRERSEKRYNVTKMVDLRKTWSEIMAEIEKCDVRCSNCHRIRTAAQLVSRRHRMMEEVIVPSSREAAMARLARLFDSARPTGVGT